MFRQEPTIELKLNDVLRRYEEVAASNPQQLRECLPATELWRLFIDGYRQSPHGWLAFEHRERGYLRSLYHAFDELFDPGVTLIAKWIQQIHETALSGVERTNYCFSNALLGKEDDAGVGEYRSMHYGDFRIGGFYFHAGAGRNATVEGIESALNRYDQENTEQTWRGFSISNCKKVFSMFEDILLSKEVIEQLREYVKMHDTINFIEILRFIKPFTYPDFYRHIWEGMPRTDAEKLVSIIVDIGKTTDNQSLAACLAKHSITDKESPFEILFVSGQLAETEKQLDVDVEKYLDCYHREISEAVTPLEKLTAIVNFIQSAEQLHPFTDGNCRTFCMLILNYLLMQSGFPFVIMDNPNRFDLFTHDQVMNEVVEGMENTFKLLKEGKLYNISTDDILNKLRNPDPSNHKACRAAQARLKYFTLITGYEVKNRLAAQHNSSNDFTP